jgi:hypothetical protein
MVQLRRAIDSLLPTAVILSCGGEQEMRGWLNFLRNLPRSFYSASWYREVTISGRGSGLGHLAKLSLLLFLAGLPGFLSYYFQFRQDFRDWYGPFLTQTPELRLENGILVVNAEMPYTMRDTRTGEAKVLFDTTGTVTSLEGSTAFALFTQSELLFVSDEGIKTFDLTAWPGVVEANAESMLMWQTRMASWLMPLGYVFICALKFSGFVFLAGLSCIAGLLWVELSAQPELNLVAITRLAAVSTTPAVFMLSVLDWVELGGWCLSPLIAATVDCCYMSFALWANRSKSAAASPIAA